MTLDTVVWIASMTKAITATAAMQLVDRGKLSLESPASAVVSGLAAAKVLEGFDSTGKPLLRPPRRAITLRHLLTHTAGFAYEIWSPAIARYQTAPAAGARATPASRRRSAATPSAPPASLNISETEVAQQMANHESARTTGLYDHRNDQVNLPTRSNGY